MSKKHYEMIAKVIKKVSVLKGKNEGETEAVKATAESIALDLTFVFETDNENFDSDRFLTACGFSA